jgi:hypothetical protein
MIRGNALFWRHVTEHRALLDIFSSHRLKHKDAVLSSMVTALPQYLFHQPAKRALKDDKRARLADSAYE